MKTPPEERTTEAVAMRLVLTRQALGLTQAEFAARAGVSATAYNQCEKAKHKPSYETAIDICDAHNLTLDWIFRGDPSGLTYETANAIKAIRAARKSP